VHSYFEPRDSRFSGLSFRSTSLTVNFHWVRPRALHSHTMASSSSNVVGVHYRVGKKIGEGSFGVIFEGTNLLNNQQVAIKFVRTPHMSTILKACFIIEVNGKRRWILAHTRCRNLERVMHLSYETNIEHTRSSSAAVSPVLSLNTSRLIFG
jgi:serine/threonine protein kinase